MSRGIRTGIRRGLTLVELLVVITILLIVAGVVLPMAQPALKGRTVREAARQVQVFLEAARAKAIADHKYVGVRFDRVPLEDLTGSQPPRWNHVDDVAYQIREVELPTALQFPTPVIAIPSGTEKPLRHLVGIPTTAPPSPPFAPELDTWSKVIERSVVSLGSYPQLFRIRVVPSPIGAPAGSITVYLESLGDPCGLTVSSPIYPPATSLPVKIYLGFAEPRFAVSTSADLPIGAYVDLSWSGTRAPVATHPVSNQPNRANQGKFWDDGRPVTLVFGPDGSLQLVYGAMDTGIGNVDDPRYRRATSAVPPIIQPNVCSPFRPRGDMFLLVSNAPRRKDRELVNFRPDSGSFWVIISPKTGTITTTANLGAPSFDIPEDPAQYPVDFMESWLYEMRISASKAIGA